MEQGAVPTELSYHQRVLALEQQAYKSIVNVLAEEGVELEVPSWVEIRKIVRNLVDYTIATSGGQEVPADARAQEGW
jgi:hypothetical protein